MLSGQPLDARFLLGVATPAWVRFETEAPVDDILVATSADGFVAIQAKTTVSLSCELNSPFGKTVLQFVKHWIVCRDGDRSSGWNRPLDRQRDRLVLAVGPQTPATIRVHLRSALQRKGQPGGGVPTQAQSQAFDIFETCVQTAWSSITSETFPQQLLDDLIHLVVVLPFDPNGADGDTSANILSKALLTGADAVGALAGLALICGQLMAERLGADLVSLRQVLVTKGVRLSEPPRYGKDIAALRAHSENVAKSLERYEVIEAEPGQPISIERECQSVVNAAAEAGSLLIVGEPGAGKSGVLNALARQLRVQGHDVLELAVDSYSVESFEGLSKELKLENGLLDVLKAWDGSGPGWLIIDALDATRGSKGEGVFRALIEQVLDRNTRWQVIASIRAFDLRIGMQFRKLFRGMPPSTDLSEPSFSSVRHIRIPPWSASEFDRLLEQAPRLARAFAGAPARLRELAATPFNTRLIADLISDGALNASLNNVSSQTELLQLYWEYRIDQYGLPALVCLKRIVEIMVNGRALRAPLLEAAGTDPAMVDVLPREGVLLRVEGDRWIQFRHHLLFDFAVAQLLLDPEGLVNGTIRFPKEEAQGLVLAPAMAFVLQKLWDTETNRARFWRVVVHLLTDTSGDPVIKSAVGRISAEHPTADNDALRLAEQAHVDARVIVALSHISSALAVRLEDEVDTPLEPWIRLIGALAPSAPLLSGRLRFLLFLFLERATGQTSRAELGFAARSLLAYGLSLPDPGNLMKSAIGFVADTYGTDPDSSRDLLAALLAPMRLQSFASVEIPALCHKISAFAELDPMFAIKIYAETYGFNFTEQHKTLLWSSQILPLTSNTKQDYEMARYELGEFFPTFLEKQPKAAIDALICAVEGFVARDHGISPEAREHTLKVNSRMVRMREDLSYVWAHDPDNPHGQDGSVLLAKFR